MLMTLGYLAHGESALRDATWALGINAYALWHHVQNLGLNDIEQIAVAVTDVYGS